MLKIYLYTGDVGPWDTFSVVSAQTFVSFTDVVHLSRYYQYIFLLKYSVSQMKIIIFCFGVRFPTRPRRLKSVTGDK